MAKHAGPLDICLPSPTSSRASACRLVCHTCSTTPPGPSRSVPASLRERAASHCARAVAVVDWRVTRTERVRSERRRSQASSEPMLEPV